MYLHAILLSAQVFIMYKSCFIRIAEQTICKKMYFVFEKTKEFLYLCIRNYNKYSKVKSRF